MGKFCNELNPVRPRSSLGPVKAVVDITIVILPARYKVTISLICITVDVLHRDGHSDGVPHLTQGLIRISSRRERSPLLDEEGIQPVS